MQPVIEGHFVDFRRERIHADIRANMQMFGHGRENAQEWLSGLVRNRRGLRLRLRLFVRRIAGGWA